MQLLILVAHGSRLESSNDEIRELTKNIKKQNEELLVDCAFLELTKPSISEVVEKWAKQEIKEIKIFPYFLAAGRHVKEDIPKELKSIKSIYPDIDFQVLDYLGNCEGIIDLIVKNSTKSS